MTKPTDKWPPPGAEDLLRAGSNLDPAPPELRRSVEARLAVTLAAGVVATAAAGVATKGAAAAKAGGVAKAILLAVGAVVAGGAVLALVSLAIGPAPKQLAPVVAPAPPPVPVVREAPSPAPEPAVVPAVVEPAPPVRPARVPKSPRPAAPPPPAIEAAPPVSETAPAQPPVPTERALLESAREALGHGDAARALELLEHSVAAHPEPLLAEERDALWVQALAGAGRAEEARAKGSEFQARYPASLLRAAVRRTLRSIP